MDSIHMEPSLIPGALVGSHWPYHYVSHNRAKYLLPQICSLVGA